MAVHGVKKSHEAAASEDIYSSLDPTRRVPRFRMPVTRWSHGWRTP